MTCLGVFRIEEIRDNDNETSLKERGGIEISNYSAFHIRDARSPSLELLTFHNVSNMYFLTIQNDEHCL